MPTPVSLTDTSTDPSTGTARTSIRPPSGGVGQQVQHRLLDLPLVRPYVAEPGVDGGPKRLGRRVCEPWAPARGHAGRPSRTARHGPPRSMDRDLVRNQVIALSPSQSAGNSLHDAGRSSSGSVNMPHGASAAGAAFVSGFQTQFSPMLMSCIVPANSPLVPTKTLRRNAPGTLPHRSSTGTSSLMNTLC